MELSDQILKALMDVDQERGHFFSLKSVTDKHRPPLSPAKIAKIIDRLEENGHIQTSAHKTKGVPHFIKVNSAAYKYFKAKDARKSVIESRRTGYAERFHPLVEKAEPVGWSLKTALICYVLGVISGMVLLLLLRQ
ncbi:MAG: hypothetical protein AB9917_11870 [Negativicutes bacterium]